MLTAAVAGALHPGLSAELVVPVEDVGPQDGLLEAELGVLLDAHPPLQDLCAGTALGGGGHISMGMEGGGPAAPWGLPALGKDLEPHGDTQPCMGDLPPHGDHPAPGRAGAILGTGSPRQDQQPPCAHPRQDPSAPSPSSSNPQPRASQGRESRPVRCRMPSWRSPGVPAGPALPTTVRA